MDRSTQILSTLSSFNSILNDFPKLLTINYVDGGDDTSATISFLLDIASLFGMTEEKLFKWISRIMADDEDNPAATGILNIIEDAIKAALILYFKGLYTCEVDPLLPDDFLAYASPYNMQEQFPTTSGAVVSLNAIDAFSVLKNCPTNERGSLFYFDITEPKDKLYMSTDFNVWLWYIINIAAPFKSDGSYNFKAWDNRVYHRKKFKGVNGDANRETFINSNNLQSAAMVVHFDSTEQQFFKKFGVKKNILIARYEENGTTIANSNVLHVYGAAETYQGTGLLGQNKSVFAFNTDYILSLKLFDSKTLTATVVNAIMGIANDLLGEISLEMSIFMEKTEAIVEKVIELPVSTSDDSYFEFSEDEYNEIVNNAMLKYNGQYDTQNETNDIVTLDTDGVVQAIKKIDSAITSQDKESAITYVISSMSDAAKKYNIGLNTPFTANFNLIKRFIKELVKQISLQILTPKVMLLFALNDYFLNGKQPSANIDFNKFFKDFKNIIKSCILEIADKILESLWDLVVGSIRPILALVVKKLLLETLMYYKELLLNLLGTCGPLTINIKRNNFVIDNVNYADIIPEQTAPKENTR